MTKSFTESVTEWKETLKSKVGSKTFLYGSIATVVGVVVLLLIIHYIGKKHNESKRENAPYACTPSKRTCELITDSVPRPAATVFNGKKNCEDNCLSLPVGSFTSLVESPFTN